MVLPLSTTTSHDCSSNFQCCVLIKRSLLRCHIVLIVHQSPVCLASSSVPLRTSVVFPNKQLWLAASVAPHCLRCGIKHLSHDAEAVFAFFYYRISVYPKVWNVKLLIYFEVPLPLLHILLGYRIQHSDCFSPCGILDHTSGLAPFVLLCSSFTLMIEHHNYQLIVRTSCFGLLWNRTPILLTLTERLWAYILSDHNNNPCDDCLTRQRYAFSKNRVISNAGLHSQTLASAGM